MMGRGKKGTIGAKGEVFDGGLHGALVQAHKVLQDIVHLSKRNSALAVTDLICKAKYAMMALN